MGSLEFHQQGVDKSGDQQVSNKCNQIGQTCACLKIQAVETSVRVDRRLQYKAQGEIDLGANRVTFYVSVKTLISGKLQKAPQ